MNARNIGLAGLLVLGAAAIAADSAAEPIQANVAKRATFEIKTVAATPAPYHGGPLTIEVLIATWGTSASTATVKLDTPGAAQVVGTTGLPAVPPNAKTPPVDKLVKLVDPAGLTSGCMPKEYTLSVSNGDGASDASQKYTVTPSCKFTTTLVDDWNLDEPDRVVERKAVGAYLDGVVMEVAPSCTAGPKFKATIINHTKKSSPSVIVQASYNHNEILAQTTAAFPLAINESKSIVLAPVGRADVPPNLRLLIVDWTKSLGVEVLGHHTVKIDRTCTLATAKVTPADPPRAIPR